MDGRGNPSAWRLWHPNQGVVFQQPLYPALDAARFFTEASAAKETGTSPSCAEEDIARDVSKYIQKPNGGRGKSAERDAPQKPGRGGKPTGTACIASLHTTTNGAETQTGGVGTDGADLQAQEGVDAGMTTEQGTKAAAGPETPKSPPFTPLDYKMPEDLFQAASSAAEGSPESYWSYTLYRGPVDEKADEKVENKVKVHYCKSAHTAERVCQYFLNEKVIGFDLEWSPDGYRYPSPRRNVSLVQLASQSRIALLHIAMFPSKDDLVAPSLRKIMEDPEITKVGVWIKGDCNRLEKYLGVKSRGIFELSHLFKQVKYSANGRLDLINKKLVSLADQVREILRLPLFKGQGVRASDWSQALAMDQIIYSASDAYAAVHLFATLNHQRENLDPTPPLPFHAELGRPIPLALGADSSSSSSDEADSADFEAEAETEAVEDTDGTWSPERFGEVEKRLKALGERLKSLGEIVQVDEDDGALTDSKPTATTKSATPRRAAVKASKPSAPPKDPRIVAAETWLMEYRSTRPDGKTTAGAAALRAYFMWHANDDLGPEGVAALLREPPLQTGTVLGYILQSLKLEKLPYDKVRLKREVLDEFPKDVARKAYPSLLRATDTVESSTEGPN